MKPMMEIANMLTTFVPQKAGLLSSAPFFVAMSMQFRSSLIGLMSCFLFSGCTGLTYSSHFDCPMGEGAGCASISRVNKMIDRREIDLGNDDAPLAKGDAVCQDPGRQVYVYYGPDQLSRLISVDGQEGNQGNACSKGS